MPESRRRFFFDNSYGLVPKEISKNQFEEIERRVQTFLDKHDPEDRTFAVFFSLRGHGWSKKDPAYDLAVQLVSETVMGTLYVDVHGHGSTYFFETFSWGVPLHGDMDLIDDNFVDEACDA